MDEGRQVRLKRLAMRSWRRGTKEMDLVLGPFADAELGSLAPGALELYEALLGENDQDLYLWISGQASIPPRHREVIALIHHYHGMATTR